MTLDFQSPSNLLVLLRPSCVPSMVRIAILLCARNIYLQSCCCAELAKQMSALCWRGSLLFGSHRDQPGRGARQSSRRESLTVHSPPGSQMCRAPPGHRGDAGARPPSLAAGPRSCLRRWFEDELLETILFIQGPREAQPFDARLCTLLCCLAGVNGYLDEIRF